MESLSARDSGSEGVYQLVCHVLTGLQFIAVLACAFLFLLLCYETMAREPPVQMALALAPVDPTIYIKAGRGSLMPHLRLVHGYFGDLGGLFAHLKSPRHALGPVLSLLSSSTKFSAHVKEESFEESFRLGIALI